MAKTVQVFPLIGLKWTRVFVIACAEGHIWTAVCGFVVGYGFVLIRPDGSVRYGTFRCPMCGCENVRGTPLTGDLSEAVKEPSKEHVLSEYRQREWGPGA